MPTLLALQEYTGDTGASGPISYEHAKKSAQEGRPVRLWIPETRREAVLALFALHRPDPNGRRCQAPARGMAR